MTKSGIVESPAAARPAARAATGTDILVAEHLRKEYKGGRVALRDLSFTLKAGRVLGFLGPNGAGKTTAIRILTTILEPTGGRFVVDGVTSDHPEELRRRIGVLPESLGFPKTNTPIEHLVYYARLYGQSSKRARESAARLIEEVGLQARAKNLIGTFSRGMRQRLGIARSLINDPAVVFLDEPTLGLDPRGQKELLSLVRRIAEERNASIVLCSHLLSEIEGVCDDAVILSTGVVVANGTVNDVIKQAQVNAIQRGGMRVHVPAEASAQAREVLETMPGIAQVISLSSMGEWLGIDLADQNGGDPAKASDINNRILEGLIKAKVPILSFQSEGGRLQDAFLHLTDEAIK